MCELATRKLCRFKHEPGSRDWILIIYRIWYYIIEIDFIHNTEEENVNLVERFYDIHRHQTKDILEKQFHKYLTLPQQHDENHLINMVEDTLTILQNNWK
jgi:hypothetical protein